jgi:hypothetical protein
MIGPILILIGLYWFWVLWHGKAGAMWNAITGNNNFNVTLDQLANAVNPYLKGGSGGSSSSGGSTSSSAPVSGNTPDSGTHMGIDSSGNIITINSTYGNMTGAEQDAANAYAHEIGNVG